MAEDPATGAGKSTRADADSEAALITAGEAAMDAARLGFHRQFPARSAKRRLHFTQLTAIAAVFAGLTWAMLHAPAQTFSALHLAALTLFAAAIAWRLFAAANLDPVLSRIAQPRQWPAYTILCPLYREANVVRDLAAALDRIDYPKDALDIKLLVEGDDDDTRAAAAAAAAGAAHMSVVVVPPSTPRTKPKALNVGLALARGKYVAVYDAEDRPHPLQLRAALAAFDDNGSDLVCVQATLAIDNADASWISHQFAAEYAIQFHEILPQLARLGWPMPLGGSSNHFRTEALRRCGGWDPFNVTEDADLGYRFARERLRCGVISPPTWEEAPATLGAWLKQRTRWIKGHLHTWLILMRNPFRTAHEMGLVRFLAMQLVLGGGLLAAVAHGPLAFVVLVAALSPYDLLGAADFMLALSGYSVAVFAALTASALARNLDHARAALTMPLYWPLSTIAAILALFGFLFRPHHWAKTKHGVSRRSRYIGAPFSKRQVSAPSFAARGRI